MQTETPGSERATARYLNWYDRAFLRSSCCVQRRGSWRLKKDEDADFVINGSLNQTLSRTLVTSGTTLAVVVCLYIFGGEMIRGFSIALAVGILIGTYSSIYIASSALITMQVSRQDLLSDSREEKSMKESESFLNSR